MLRHYLILAARNLAKQKVLALINVLGLSIGIACFSLFLLFALYQFSFDNFHQNKERIYRVNEWHAENQDRAAGGSASSYTPLGPAFKQDIPGVKEFVRFNSGWGENFVKAGNETYRLKISFADPQIFDVFSFPLIAGNASSALKNANQIVLTRDKALALFGSTDIVGRRVDIKMENNFEPFVVGAVAENIPSNSTIKFDVLGSFNYILNSQAGKESLNNWHMTIGIETYVLLAEGSSLPNQPDQMTAFRKKYYADEIADYKQRGIWNGKGPLPVTFQLQPLTKVHLDPSIEDSFSIDPKNIWMLIMIVSAVLLIACINFTTLAIGRSAGRSKEVGVRKVIGGRTKQLISQFLTESVLLSFISAGLGILLAYLLLPYFNKLSGAELEFSFKKFPQLGWLLLLLTVIVGLLAGSYPAFVLSGFRPVEVLKSKIKVGGLNLFTKSLVTFQFTISIVLILCTIIILQQLHFMRTKPLGFDKENVVVIDASGAEAQKLLPLFKQALSSKTSIAGVTASEMGLGEGEGQMGGGYKINETVTGVIEYPVDDAYLTVMGMRLIAGRNFNSSISSDTVSSVIVNEALVKQALKTTPEAALGVQFGSAKGPRRGEVSKTIIGVVKDFNYEPLYRSVRPQLFRYPSHFEPSRFFVRIRNGNPSEAISTIESAWKKLVPGLPLKFSFLDEKVDMFYKSEERWSKIMGWAGGISIFLACLGLFGLSALSVVNRIKEIGIRKVLGASVAGIIQLLSKDFLKLILLALIIATCSAWFLMNKWLQDFEYRIPISWWIMALASLVIIVLALVTISLQAIKAALMNPVKTLRTE